MEGVLSAGVHYNDWKGTFAADNEDLGGVEKWLREQAILKENEALVAVIIHGLHTGNGAAALKALITDGAGFDDVKAKIASEDRLSLTERKVEIPIQDFFRLFKQFQIVFSRKGLELDGRNYHTPD